MSISKACQFYGLAQIYPKEKYTQNQELRLHYLIVYQQVQSAADWLQKYPQSASSIEPKWHLTPLHLCAIVGDKKTAGLLLASQEVSIVAQDLRKWTPLHHAVVAEDQEMVELLESAAKARRVVFAILQNCLGATYLDLQIMLRFPDYGEELVFYYQNKEGEIKPGTAKEFQEMTGCIYCKRLFTSSEALIENWKDCEEGDLSNAEINMVNDLDLQVYGFNLPTLHSFRARPPCVYLAKDPQAPEIGYGLFAREDIQPGQIIEEYAGEYVPPSQENRMNRNYSAEDIDAEKFANLASKANDSFPNSAFFVTNAIEGVFRKPALIATSFIKKGGRITVDYGYRHPVKKENHKELRKEQLLHFLQDFTTHWKVCQKLAIHDPSRATIKEMDILVKMIYVFSTPHALFRVVFDKIFSREGYEELSQQKNLMLRLDIDGGKTFENEIQTYFSFQELHAALPEPKQKIVEDFIQKIETSLSGRDFIRALVFLVNKKEVLANIPDLEWNLYNQLYPELAFFNHWYTTIFSSSLSIEELRGKEQELAAECVPYISQMEVFFQMCIDDCDILYVWQKNIGEKKKWLHSCKTKIHE